MKKLNLLPKLLIGALSTFAVVSTASADLVFPSLSYRTGPFAVNGIPFADGYADYMTLLNERDGGCLLYTSPSPRDATLSRMPSSA